MILKAEKLSREFIRESRGTNRFIAVKETDLTVEGGIFTVIMGRSGSGKSTLLNMLGGLLEPTSGKVSYDSVDIYGLSDRELSRLRNGSVGFIPQGQTALHSLSVIENILMPYTLFREDITEAEKYAEELMERLDIAELKNEMPSALSGGELRRMAIARAVIRKPGIILADEPTGDLDDENTETVFGFLRDSARAGAAVIAVTHENTASKYADRVLRMTAGELQG